MFLFIATVANVSLNVSNAVEVLLFVDLLVFVVLLVLNVVV